MKLKQITKITKTVTNLALSIGAPIIVEEIVKNNIPKNKKAITSVCIGITALIIGDMIAENLQEWAEERIDRAEKMIVDVSKKIGSMVDETLNTLEEDSEGPESQKEIYGSIEQVLSSIKIFDSKEVENVVEQFDHCVADKGYVTISDLLEIVDIQSTSERLIVCDKDKENKVDIMGWNYTPAIEIIQYFDLMHEIYILKLDPPKYLFNKKGEYQNG